MIRHSLALIVLLVPTVVRADNWPQWRGPEGNGVSRETELPITWTEKSGIVWKRPLPRSLKSKKLIEGRRPNLFVAAKIAAATDSKAEYIKKRAFDKTHYRKMVLAYLEKFGEAKREDIDKLLRNKLSDALTEKQKSNWIKNLLQEMRQDGTIRKGGAASGLGALWQLSKSEVNLDI